MELVADLDDVAHQLLRLVGVHARRRLVQQQQRRMRGQCAHDLQTPLRAVGQRAGHGPGQVLHVEDAQQLQRLLVLLLLLLPVGRKAEDAGKHAVFDLVVQADAHVVLHRHVAEQSDVLERAGNAQLVGLDGVHAGGVLAVDHDGAHRGLIDLREQVEHGGLARAVGADQAGDLGLADDEIEVVHGLQAAELDAQVPRLQHGRAVVVALGDDAVAGRGHHLGVQHALFRGLGHSDAPPLWACDRLFPGWISRSNSERMNGLFVASMTRISTMAYTSMR